LSFLFRVLNCPGERGNEDRNSALFSIKWDGKNLSPRLWTSRNHFFCKWLLSS
jgi:hypothetical protein